LPQATALAEDGNNGETGPEKHWAFRPVGSPRVSNTKNAQWARNPIDSFVLNALEREGLAPAKQADRLVLLRRAHFNLVGLPPSPEEVEAFARDERPDSYRRLIERLLSSPHYGERWGRHWLDVARYADTGGFEVDHEYPSAWRYRDYVIRSLNAGKPFDRFIQEQVGGDELWPDDPDSIVGGTLYCIGPVLPESVMVDQQLDYEWLTDAADTTGAAFLGITFGCARCHDHKYDPITQRDYYALQAIFAASDRPYPAKIRLARIKALRGLLSEAPVPDSLLNDPACTTQSEERVGFRLFHRPDPLPIHRLHRGELSKRRELVEPAIPRALHFATTEFEFSGVPSSRRRATLAGWLTSQENPLTARVVVNRVWAWHFGAGLVRTPSDFGAQGEEPTHPELLDWLVRDFLEHGWDLKRLHRRILTSSTYMMTSVAGGPGLRTDPENRLLWHFPRHRLEGELIRDAMLACCDRANLRMYGPSVVPPLSKQELTGLFDAEGKWPITKDVREHDRRSVYLRVRRTFAYPLFATFDPPEVMTSCPRRMQTVVPAQALTLLNSPLARELAAAFASRLVGESGEEPQALVERAWTLAFARPVSPAERVRSLAFLQERTAALAGSADKTTVPSSQARQQALAELCLALFNANEFIYVD
jgi:hypothetical protein